MASRRKFIKSAGAVGLIAGTSSLISCSTDNGKKVHSKPEQNDPTVKQYAGPFGEGVPITMAGYDYNRVRPIADGRVTIEGCQHKYEVTSIGPLNNHAFFDPQKRDVTEIGLIPYILAYANDEFRDYTLLPIPVLRLFRHKSIYVRIDSGIKTPADLKGKKVATVGYSSSGLTHVRGVLQEEYGVKPEDITWIAVEKDSGANLTGGVSNWEKVRPKGVTILDAPEGEDESTLLIKGEVDAILHPAEPKVYQDRNPIVERLFTDHRTVEQDFYKRTGMFPIMHSIAIKKETSEKNPWMAKAVFEGYTKAKKIDYDYMRTLGWAYDSLPWYGQEFNETRALMGQNFYPYGLQASASSYEAACRYVYDQKLSKRKVSLEEMFEKSTLDLIENLSV